MACWLTTVSFNYPKDVCFLCLRCAICCGDTETKTRHILLLETEAKRIAELTSKPIREFAEKTANHDPYVYEMRKTADEGKCIFLKDNGCTIYQLRPLVCRFYPFELRVAENGKHVFLYTRECPGIGQGRKLTKGYFGDLFRQLETLSKLS